jgi:hypothetical protein
MMRCKQPSLERPERAMDSDGALNAISKKIGVPGSEDGVVLEAIFLTRAGGHSWCWTATNASGCSPEGSKILWIDLEIVDHPDIRLDYVGPDDKSLAIW